MVIEITMVDIIWRVVAVGGVIFCVALNIYERHKIAKWLKDK